MQKTLLLDHHAKIKLVYHQGFHIVHNIFYGLDLHQDNHFHMMVIVQKKN
jgi:regulator of replication initiation timing